jgi:NAD(P)-dependent dehydrogenase (short-subunit alcohol dehydrogenase family)
LPAIPPPAAQFGDEEIAPAFVFLASPHCSSYITGEILPVVGGY